MKCYDHDSGANLYTLPEERNKEHDKIASRLDGEEHEIMIPPIGGGMVPRNPFASAAQRGYMHAHPEVLGKKALAEWDRASKGKKLPEHVGKK